MNTTLILLVAGAALVALILVAIFRKHLPWWAWAAIFVAGVIPITVGWNIGKASLTTDVEIWNGQVTGKERNRVSCEHSYPCNCRQVCSGSGSSRSCSTVCDTCYDHPWDYDWDVHTSAGDFTVARVDRQGSTEPSRWTAVQAGQPASIAHSFTNYIKAVPESVMHENSESLLAQFGAKVPTYPSGTYDYHYHNHALSDGTVPVPYLNDLNKNIRDMLRTVGPGKRVNVVVLFTKNPSPDYGWAAQYKWLGGKKNDLVAVISTADGKKANWVHMFSWSTNKMVDKTIRDDVMALEEMTAESLTDVLRTNINKYFEKRSMNEFRYLDEELEPSTLALTITAIISIIMAVGVTFVCMSYNTAYSRRYRF